MTKDRIVEIRERADALWEAECRPEGRALDHWLCAKAEIEGEAEGESREEPVGSDASEVKPASRAKK